MVDFLKGQLVVVVVSVVGGGVVGGGTGWSVAKDQFYDELNDCKVSLVEMEKNDVEKDDRAAAKDVRRRLGREYHEEAEKQRGGRSVIAPEGKGW